MKPPLGRSAAVDHALFAIVPACLTAYLLREVFAGHLQAVDFRQAYWVAGVRIEHGASPYAWSHAAIAAGAAFVYPALAGLLFVPFGTLQVTASEVLFTVICMLAALATLRVLAVHDWRLYGLALVSSPVVAGWQTANLTLLLVLGVALLWRHRNRPAAAGALAAVVVSLKPFTWPVALWLLATHRYRATAWGLGVGIAINVASWAVIGFGQISRFLHLSRQVTDALSRTGYGVIALATHLGASRTAGTVVEAILSVAVAVALIVVARRGHDRESLTLCIALMLLASPLVWNHYLALLIVPLAIARPRLSWLWAGGLVLWACPSDGASTWQVLLAWLVVVTTIWVLLRAVGATVTSARVVARSRLVTGGGA